MFSPDKLKMDFKKVSPVGGLKRMFGVDALMQFVKSLVKIALVAWIGYLVVKPHMAELSNLAAMDPMSILPSRWTSSAGSPSPSRVSCC